MSGIFAVLFFGLLAAPVEASVKGERCKLLKKTYFFSSATSGGPTKTLARGEVLTLGTPKGKRISVTVTRNGEKGFIPLKWSQKACDKTPLPVPSKEPANPQPASESESTKEKSPAPGDHATSDENAASDETETDSTESGEATTTASDDSQNDDGGNPDSSKADPDDDETSSGDAEDTSAPEADRIDPEGAPPLVPDATVQSGDTPDSQPSTSEAEAVGSPAADDATGDSTEDVEANDAPSSPDPTIEPTETSVVQEGTLNPSKLPKVVRSEPKIFEPLIGRDKIKRVVVLDTRVDNAIGESLDGGGMGALIAAELQNLGGGLYEVVARADLMALVTRLEQAQLMGCADESCMTDIGALAEADFLVASSVTKAGEGRLLTVELLEAVSGQALRREAVTWTGDTQGLVELCAPQTARLVDAERGQSHSGSIQLVASEDGAEVYVNEELAGETPIDIFANLDIGSHRITVKKDGYNLFEIPVVVGRNQTALVQAELIRPWYREWWVWTAAGAVLTTAVLSFALSGDDITQELDPNTITINSPGPETTR